MSLPANISEMLSELRFMPDRLPTSTEEELAGAFASVANYREGGIFVGHWAGASEWERHPVGDEIVAVIDGATTMVLLNDDGTEDHNVMSKGDLLVVPKGRWHRFVTSGEVKVFTVTPQPTDHRVDRPVSD